MTSSKYLSPHKAGIIFCLLAAVYVVVRLFPLDVILITIASLLVIAAIIRTKWKALRKFGMVNYLSEKARELLLRKSILDIFSDFLYFPYFSEILKAFAMAVVQKPPPQKLFSCFADLPSDVREVIATKGILHLAPSRVEELMLEEDCKDMDQDYGKMSTKWYNHKRYEVEAPKRRHKTTLQQKIMKKIADRPWKAVFVLGLVTVLASRKWGNLDIKKLLARRGFQLGIVLCTVSLVPILIRRTAEKKLT